MRYCGRALTSTAWQARGGGGTTVYARRSAAEAVSSRPLLWVRGDASSGRLRRDSLWRLHHRHRCASQQRLREGQPLGGDALERGERVARRFEEDWRLEHLEARAARLGELEGAVLRLGEGDVEPTGERGGGGDGERGGELLLSERERSRRGPSAARSRSRLRCATVAHRMEAKPSDERASREPKRRRLEHAQSTPPPRAEKVTRYTTPRAPHLTESRSTPS